MPESPKFYVATGHPRKALIVLRRMFAINTGENPDLFPVKNLISEVKIETHITDAVMCTRKTLRVLKKDVEPGLGGYQNPDKIDHNDVHDGRRRQCWLYLLAEVLPTEPCGSLYLPSNDGDSEHDYREHSSGPFPYESRWHCLMYSHVRSADILRSCGGVIGRWSMCGNTKQEH
ncbi:hypothetical protein NQ314_004168 [Rhamnusium bicolor]|uniref:Uncharacterized protein n=1 Tax=Rhamnusium bicolor TaxID=1586634 RepID=A0AAV8ZK63_9CUCU|nr:hypothetical protein NQ314_004168 [Rhamnusium bicolor]